MAKWGEGDPRWIVEERPDATNVNNWHWTEKNATPWSKERFNELFNNLKIEQKDIECVVESVDKCTGEATVNNRKGKLIFFYEWELVLRWSGTLPARSKNVHKGKVTIPNLSEENDLKDVELTVTIDESNDESETIKQYMYNVGRDVIRKQLELYIKELKEEYSKDLILPKKGEENEGNVKTNVSKTAAPTNNNINRNDNNTNNRINNQNTLGYKLDVKDLSMSIEFHCSADDLYNALTTTDMLTAFTGAPAKIDPTRGGEFSLYNGNVQGKFQELIRGKSIEQTWRLKNWPSGHYSNVFMKFEESNGSTNLYLTQTGIPATEYNFMEMNWQRYYWHSIKRTFGFGAALSDVL